MTEIIKTMTFHDGKVIVDDPNGISYIGPCPKVLEADDVMKLMTEHGFVTEENDDT